jgi:hypothetical protein
MTEPKKKLVKALLRVAQGIVTAFATYFKEEYQIEPDGVKRTD